MPQTGIGIPEIVRLIRYLSGRTSTTPKAAATEDKRLKHTEGFPPVTPEEIQRLFTSVPAVATKAPVIIREVATLNMTPEARAMARPARPPDVLPETIVKDGGARRKLHVIDIPAIKGAMLEAQAPPEGVARGEPGLISKGIGLASNLAKGGIGLVGKAFSTVGKALTILDPSGDVGRAFQEAGGPEMLARMAVGFGTSPSGVPSAGARVGQQIVKAREAQQAVEAQRAESGRAERLVNIEKEKAATEKKRVATEEAELSLDLDRKRKAVEDYIATHGEMPYLQMLLDNNLVEEAFAAMKEIQFGTKRGLSPFDLNNPAELPLE